MRVRQVAKRVVRTGAADRLGAEGCFDRETELVGREADGGAKLGEREPLFVPKEPCLEAFHERLVRIGRRGSARLFDRNYQRTRGPDAVGP
jgi:hypothetical protein